MHANGAKRAKYEAQIGFHTTFSSYLDDYHRVVDILFDQIEENDVPVNVISCPLLFLVRHSLELGYKLNIKHLSKYSRSGHMVNSKTHHLRELHEAFRLHFTAVVKALHVGRDIADEFQRRCEDLEKLMKTFDDIDRGSFSFRYPEDTEQRVVFKHNETMNLLDVKDLYHKAMVLLSYTADVLSDFTDHVDYMNKLMEDEQRTNYDHG